MKTRLAILCVLLIWAGGCEFAFENPVENDSDTQSDSDLGIPPKTEFHKPLYMQEDPNSPEEVDFVYAGVDVLLVVDNSGSMDEEQALMSTALFDMVNALNNPRPGWPYPPVDGIRVGVISTDMGLVYGPSDTVPDNVPVVHCGGSGDNAQFIPEHIPDSVELKDMTITCDGFDGTGCPEGWTCVDENTNGIGACSAPGGDTSLNCELIVTTDSWTSSSQGSPNAAISEEVACLANLGTDGCGVEQQLKSAVRSAVGNRDSFLRGDALLAVFLLTDEEDCSIESEELFDTPEFSNEELRKFNLACASNTEHLMPVGQIKDALISAKGGDERAVVFGALAGVPTADVCEGGGHVIGSCLQHDDMQFVPVEEPGSGQWVERPACERYVHDSAVTTARPGRRIVLLAQHLWEYGYVYSVCNNDYSAIMTDFSKQILRGMQRYQPITPK